MPVTKKKGAIFAIYADTPPRASIRGQDPAQAPSSSSSRGQSPTGSGSRRALTPLQPAPTSSSSSVSKPPPLSRKLSVYEDDKPRPASSASTRKMAVYADEPSEPSKPSTKSRPSSRPALGDKSNARSLSTSAIETYQPKSVKPTSSFKVFSDSAPKRRAASPVGDKENGGTEATSRYARSKTAPAPSKPVEKKKSGASHVRLRSIPVLADVSEAYGATGDEPLGFRDGLE